MKINRKQPFNPAKFIGEKWSIESENQDSLKIKDLDISNLKLFTDLKEGEVHITGEEKIKRLAGTMLCDAKIAQILFEEKKQKTLEEIYKKLGCVRIEFLGTVLRSPRGFRCALYLYRHGDGSWHWRCSWLDGVRGASSPALGFASQPSELEDKPSLEFQTLEFRVSKLEAIINKLGEAFNPSSQL